MLQAKGASAPYLGLMIVLMTVAAHIKNRLIGGDFVTLQLTERL